MEYLLGDRPRYEIKKLLGEGLTGQVYQAVRLDARKQTRQLVALKILKSEKDVQILQQEFAKLQAVKSNHCVRLLGWDSLNAKSTLVLEYLDGVTLYELLVSGAIAEDLLDEITSQVQLGLEDLRQHQLAHGDLTPRNIFVTSEGIVKLIDFGSLHLKSEKVACPAFMAPELWANPTANFTSDLFSLGVIRYYVKKGQWPNQPEPIPLNSTSLLMTAPDQRQSLTLESMVSRRRRLAALVKKRREDRHCWLKTSRHPRPCNMRIRLPVVSLAIFVGSLVNPLVENQVIKPAVIDVRSQTWSKVSINGGRAHFAPIYIDNLRPGTYRLQIVDSSGLRNQVIKLTPGQKYQFRL